MLQEKTTWNMLQEKQPETYYNKLKQPHPTRSELKHLET